MRTNEKRGGGDQNRKKTMTRKGKMGTITLPTKVQKKKTLTYRGGFLGGKKVSKPPKRRDTDSQLNKKATKITGEAYFHWRRNNAGDESLGDLRRCHWLVKGHERKKRRESMKTQQGK